MNNKTKIMLNQFLANNKDCPLLIETTLSLIDNQHIMLSANTNFRTILLSNEFNKLNHSGDNDHSYLVITDIENVSFEKQQNFVNLIKNRRLGQYKLPQNIQIIIPVKNKNKIIPDITKLSLVWSTIQ